MSGHIDRLREIAAWLRRVEPGYSAYDGIDECADAIESELGAVKAQLRIADTYIRSNPRAPYWYEQYIDNFDPKMLDSEGL